MTGSRPAGQRMSNVGMKEAVVRTSQSRGLCVSVSAASAAVATEEPKTQAKGENCSFFLPHFLPSLMV